MLLDVAAKKWFEVSDFELKDKESMDFVSKHMRKTMQSMGFNMIQSSTGYWNELEYLWYMLDEPLSILTQTIS